MGKFELMKTAQVGKLVKTANDHMCLKTAHTHDTDAFQKFQDANKLVKQELQKQIDCLTKKLQAAEKTLGTANKNLITRNDKYTDAKAQLRKEKKKTTQLTGDLRVLPDRHADCVLYQLLKTKIVKSAVGRGESLTRLKERVELGGDHRGADCICRRVAKLCEVAKQDILLRARANVLNFSQFQNKKTGRQYADELENKKTGLFCP